MNEFPALRRFLTSKLGCRSLTTLAALPVALAALAPRAASQAPPNIVLIVADDLGYGDVGPYDDDNDSETPMVTNTPRLDQLAQEGVKLLDFYAVAPVCTPTRASLMTGRHHARIPVMGVLGPNSQCGLPLSEITIADALRERGYATELAGKWHLGTVPDYGPCQQGFDDFYGLPYSNDMTPYVVVHDTVPVDPCPGQSTLMQTLLDRSKNFVSEAVAQSKPFFLYLPTIVPHVPVYVSTQFEGITGRGLYADCVYEMDWCIGELLDHLATLGVADNTIVMFTSDNGPWQDTHYPPPGTPELWRWVGGSAGPLRGSKAMLYEGGIRVPFLARWPGHYAEGVEISEPAICMDVFPTLTLAAGAELPTDRVIDGFDLGPLLSGAGSRGADDLYFYQLANRCDGSAGNRKLGAMRCGKWKLHFDYWENPCELFDLDADIGETTPLELPAVVAMLMDKAHNFDCGLDSPPLQPLPSTNLAIGRPTFASASVNCNTSGKAVDQAPGTSWRSGFGENQWLFVDLGQTCEVQRVILKWGTNFATRYDIDVSDDGVSWTTAHEMHTSTGWHDAVPLASTYTRFVRLHATDSSEGVGYSLTEFEIHGTSDIPPSTRGMGHSH